MSAGPVGTWTYAHRHALRIAAVGLFARQYLLLFLAVAASWAGVPFIGTAALGAAAGAASQDRLNLAAVIVVAVIAGEAGGLGG